MGSPGVDYDDKIESGDGNSYVDPSDAETQIFDSQFSPSSSSEDANGLQCTVPFDDTLPLEDAFETQIIDFASEPEVMNLDGETQVLDDLEYGENIGTQLFEECNAEAVVESDGQETEVLEDSEEFSDDDTTKKVGNHPLEQEKIIYSALCKEVGVGTNAESDALTNEPCNIGSMYKGFTSVRAASIRASGLAARNMASKGNISASCSVISNNQSVNPPTSEHNQVHVIGDSSKHWEKVNQEFTMEGFDGKMKDVRNENKCRIGTSTARKLFTEDMDLKGTDDHMNKADLVADFPPFGTENELAGLSYVDSQEPGDLSQANALDFVDRFLKFNAIEFDQEIDLGKSTGAKSKSLSSAKGTRSLSKRANSRSTVGERGIFDWDDSREDEGGGEFFQRKKETFFNDRDQKRRSSAQPRKSKFFDTKGEKADRESMNREEEHDIHDNARGLVYSDSKLPLHNQKGNGKFTKVTGANFRKKLIEELDEQLATGLKDGMVATSINANVPDMLNIGVDTQMAAEAMETLCLGVGMTDANEVAKGEQKNISKGERNDKENSKQDFLKKRACSPNSGFSKRQLKKSSSNASLRKDSCKQSKNIKKKFDKVLLKAELKKASSDTKQQRKGSVESSNLVPKIAKQRKQGDLGKGGIDEIDELNVTGSSGQISVKKRRLQEKLGYFTPIACRTRQSLVAKQSKMAASASNGCREMMSDLTGVVSKNKGKRRRPNADAFNLLNANNESTELGSSHSGKLRNIQQEKLDLKLMGSSSVANIHVDYPRGKHTSQRLSCFVQEADGKISARTKKSRIAAVNTSEDLGVERTTQLSVRPCPALSSLNRQSGEIQQEVAAVCSGDALPDSNCVNINGTAFSRDLVAQTFKHSDGKCDADFTASAECTKGNAMIEATPRGSCKSLASACNTPVNCATPVNAASPICVGDEYLKQSCRKNLCRSYLMKEINSLISTSPVSMSVIKNSRRRRDVANVRVLFSHHLDADIIKQQKKILARLGTSEAPSVSDATHFVTDKFVRTRNMLEAIAFGKPVVTHMWLESCGQASCLIDERNYILRDTKKEKEFGFSMPVSLARACQHPLLLGQRVLITSNTKPGREILASLVKAVHGLPVERIGRSALKDDKVPDDLLVLSCEEDYAVCMPFLEKGAAVYSSELLLNGIVIQKLEFERHRLFVDHVKETRSTIWLKGDDRQFLRVTKLK